MVENYSKGRARSGFHLTVADRHQSNFAAIGGVALLIYFNKGFPLLKHIAWRHAPCHSAK